jgi:hypothetical protein
MKAGIAAAGNQKVTAHWSIVHFDTVLDPGMVDRVALRRCLPAMQAKPGAARQTPPRQTEEVN